MKKICKNCGFPVENIRAKTYFCSEGCKREYRYGLEKDAGLSHSYCAYRILQKRRLIHIDGDYYAIYVFQNEFTEDVKFDIWKS